MAVQISTSYVKFIRGTKAHYDAMSAHSPDTLYFVYESKESTSGSLYLGDKLISGGSISGATKLKDLEDVLLGAGIVNKSLLTFDAASQKWVDKPIEEIYAEIATVFIGATSESAGVAGLVPAPQKADVNKFLKGDGTWAEVPSAADISALQAQVATIIGDDDDMSMREVALAEVTKLIAGAPEAFDTLKEIADWIEQHPKDIAEINSRLLAAEGNISSLQTSVGAINADLLAVKGDVIDLTSRVGNLEIKVDGLDEQLHW